MNFLAVRGETLVFSSTYVINSHPTSLSVVGGGLSAGSQQCGVQQYVHSGIWVSSGCHPDRSLTSLRYLASWYASCSSRKASRETIGWFIQQQQNSQTKLSPVIFTENPVFVHAIYLFHKVHICPGHGTISWTHLESQGAQLPHEPLLSRGFWVRVGYSSPRLQGHQHRA